jgi:hypothetical protein
MPNGKDRQSASESDKKLGDSAPWACAPAVSWPTEARD